MTRRILGTNISEAFAYAIVILVGLHAADVLTTFVAHKTGVGYEANSAAASIFFGGGVQVALWFGLFPLALLTGLVVLANQYPVRLRSIVTVLTVVAWAFVAMKTYAVIGNIHVLGWDTHFASVMHGWLSPGPKIFKG